LTEWIFLGYCSRFPSSNLQKEKKRRKERGKEREKQSQHHGLETLVEAGKMADTAPGCPLKMEALLT